MVLGDDPATHELLICSAWGPDVDWMRNLREPPRQRRFASAETGSSPPIGSWPRTKRSPPRALPAAPSSALAADQHDPRMG